MAMAVTATAGMVRPMLASAEPSARLRLFCSLSVRAALTAAILTPQTDAGDRTTTARVRHDDGRWRLVQALVRDLRVRVDVRGAAVGGPARMADAHLRRGHRVRLELGGQVGQLARLLAVVQLAVRHDGDAGGVVSAVFETAQALHQDVESAVLTIRLGLADVSDDSAHAHENTGPDPTSAHGGPGHSVRDENPAGLASCQAQRSRTIAVTSRRACQPTSAPIASTAAHDSAMSPGRRSTTR